jgi:hypothetical protein
MEELMDMIIGDESPTNISDQIKSILYAKASERVDALRPSVADTVFTDVEDTEYQQ